LTRAIAEGGGVPRVALSAIVQAKSRGCRKNQSSAEYAERSRRLARRALMMRIVST